MVYAIRSLPAEAAPPRLLTGWIRGHRSIENKVHYVRDVSSDEDRSQVRAGSGPQVMATSRNTAISRIAEPHKPTSPAPADDSQPTPTAHSTSSYKHEFPGHDPPVNNDGTLSSARPEVF